MRHPTVHLNGSSKEALFELYTKQVASVREALLTLQVSPPHARDYYPQGDEAFNEARSEHMVRLTVLHRVLDELVEIQTALS